MARSLSGGKFTAPELSAGNWGSTAATQFLGTQSAPATGRPKAYLNWILLDEQLRYYAGGSDLVGVNEELKKHVLEELPVNKNGYLYVYVSNETANIDVFFDNLQVTHTRVRLLEENHYYPFGLVMAGISSKVLNFGNPENKYRFNGGTELNSDFNVSLYETDFRRYDPQIGRFHQIDFLASLSHDQSPYAFVNNNPISFIDPLGLDTIRSATKPGEINVGDVWVKPGENGSEWFYTYDPSNADAAQDGGLQGYVSSGSFKTLDQVVVTSGGSNQNSNGAGNAGGGGAVGGAGRPPATNIPGGITFDRNANRQVVSQYTINLLSEIMRESGNPNITITSTLRTPEDQARAMFNNIVSSGVAYNLRLYGANGDRVVNVAAAGQRQGLSGDNILRNMAQEIRRIGPGRISRHNGDPNVINVLDISPHSIRNRQAFVREIRARCVFLIQPPTDPAFHLEIRQ